MKKCSKCGELKPISEFYKNKGGKYGVRSECKECKANCAKEYYENNKEHIKEYRENNKEHIKEYQKEYCETNKEQLKEYRKNNYIPRWVSKTLHNHTKNGIMYSPKLKEDLLKKALEKPPCQICHKELEWYSTGKNKPTNLSPTLDRINNDNYMDIDNVAIICHQCNLKKSSETLEENLVWCKQFEEYASNILRT
jgi:hypothetical protein